MVEKKRKEIVIVAVLSTFVLALAGLSIIHPSTSGIKDVYYFNFDKPVIETVQTKLGYFNIVKLADWPTIGNVGEPSLPSIDISFLIPDYRIINSVIVTSTSATTIWTYKKVIPEQHQEPTYRYVDNISDYNSLFYRQNKKVYNRLYDNQGITYIRGFPIITITLYPVDYNPVAWRLYWYKNITVTFNYQEGSLNNTFRRFTDDDITYLSGIVANPEALEAYREHIPPPPPDPDIGKYPGGLCDPDTVEYVIITNNALKTAWQPLANHRQNFNDFKTKIVTVEEINNCVDYWNDTVLFDDSPARIREFCKDAYLDWNTEYILLGGNWRDSIPSQQIVPYRLFSVPSLSYTYKTMPSDLYYSNLDGTFWDATKGCWGGDSGKIHDTGAELFVGRITAYDNATVNNAITKIIKYETRLIDAYFSACCFIGDDLGWTSTSKQYMEELRLGTGSYNTYMGFEEFDTVHNEYVINTETWRYYYDDLGNNWGTTFKSNIGKFSIVNHLGHSSWSVPLSLGWGNEKTDKPFFAWSQGCLAGRYCSGYAGCEQLMLRNIDSPAFGLMLNTGYGWGSSGSTAGKSQLQQKIFWDYFFNAKQNNLNEWQLGKAKVYQDIKFVAVTGVGGISAYCWYSSTLFGDPALTLRLN